VRWISAPRSSPQLAASSRSGRFPAQQACLVSGSGRRSARCSLAPLVISDTEFDPVFDALHHGLELADTELAASPAAGTW